MMVQEWSNVLRQSFQDLWLGFVSYVPNIVFALVIFVAGWIVAHVVGRVIAQIVSALKVDKGLQAAGMSDVMSRAGFALNSGMFLGELVRWFIVLGFSVASFEVLGLHQVTAFLGVVVLTYIPRVIVAALIVLVAAIAADVVSKMVIGSAKAAELAHSHLLGGIARWAIWIFATLTALEQLGIATDTINTVITGVTVAISLALGLAFGLGGKDAAKDAIDALKRDLK